MNATSQTHCLRITISYQDESKNKVSNQITCLTIELGTTYHMTNQL